jgi:hypothetical protein
VNSVSQLSLLGPFVFVILSRPRLCLTHGFHWLSMFLFVTYHYRFLFSLAHDYY